MLAEAEKLRGALAVLDPRSSRTERPKTPRPAATPKRTATAKRAARSKRAARPKRAATSKRAAPGATRTQILATLAAGQAMTAGEVAAATGLARGSVSTTLSKLAKSGEVQKAERGYRLPATGG